MSPCLRERRRACTSLRRVAVEGSVSSTWIRLEPSNGRSVWSLTSPGFDIDVDNDRYLIYSGGDTLTWVNPATGAITLEQTTGAPAAIDTNGTWGRMSYSRSLKAVLFTQDMFAGTWVYQGRQP